MNCDKFEELLIDFIEHETEISQRELVKKHLESCQNCSDKFKDYIKINRLFNEEIKPQPSPQVLNRLSKIARDDVERDRTSFWKRWSYSPILVPVLSSALALFIWINYGKKDIDYSHIETNYSRDAMAKKAPLPKEQALLDSGEKIIGDIESKSGSLSPADPLMASPEAHLSGRRAQTGVTEETANLPASEPATEEESDIDEIKEADKPLQKVEEGLAQSTIESEAKDDSFGRTTGMNSEERLEQAKLADRKDNEKDKGAELFSFRESAYNEQLILALKQQGTGNCEASIKTNNELLNNAPPPPIQIKEKVYLSLAECYEQKGEWENALFNYQALQQVSPNQTALANSKIETLRQQINLIKARQSQPLNLPSK